MSNVLDKSFIHRSYPKLAYGSIHTNILHCTKMNKMREKQSNEDYCGMERVAVKDFYGRNMETKSAIKANICLKQTEVSFNFLLVGTHQMLTLDTGRIKALLLRCKNDYCGACFGMASAATSPATAAAAIEKYKGAIKKIFFIFYN